MNNTEKRFLAHKIWQLAEAFANLGDKFDSFDEEEVDDLISEDYPYRETGEYYVIPDRSSLLLRIF